MRRVALSVAAALAWAAAPVMGQTTRPNTPGSAPVTAGPPAAQAPAQGQGAPAGMQGVQSPTETSVPGPQIIGWIRSAQTRNGQLEPGDYRMGDGTLADVWYLDVPSAQRVAIGLSAQTFDVYMQLLDPYGAKLAESPARGGHEAEIVFQITTPGRYQIVVNSAGSDPHTGAYRLSVK